MPPPIKYIRSFDDDELRRGPTTSPRIWRSNSDDFQQISPTSDISAPSKFLYNHNSYHGQFRNAPRRHRLIRLSEQVPPIQEDNYNPEYRKSARYRSHGRRPRGNSDGSSRVRQSRSSSAPPHRTRKERIKEVFMGCMEESAHKLDRAKNDALIPASNKIKSGLIETGKVTKKCLNETGKVTMKCLNETGKATKECTIAAAANLRKKQIVQRAQDLTTCQEDPLSNQYLRKDDRLDKKERRSYHNDEKMLRHTGLTEDLHHGSYEDDKENREIHELKLRVHEYSQNKEKTLAGGEQRVSESSNRTNKSAKEVSTKVFPTPALHLGDQFAAELALHHEDSYFRRLVTGEPSPSNVPFRDEQTSSRSPFYVSSPESEPVASLFPEFQERSMTEMDNSLLFESSPSNPSARDGAHGREKQLSQKVSHEVSAGAIRDNDVNKDKSNRQRKLQQPTKDVKLPPSRRDKPTRSEAREKAAVLRPSKASKSVNPSVRSKVSRTQSYKVDTNWLKLTPEGPTDSKKSKPTLLPSLNDTRSFPELSVAETAPSILENHAVDDHSLEIRKTNSAPSDLEAGEIAFLQDGKLTRATARKIEEFDAVLAAEAKRHPVRNRNQSSKSDIIDNGNNVSESLTHKQKAASQALQPANTTQSNANIPEKRMHRGKGNDLQKKQPIEPSGNVARDERKQNLTRAVAKQSRKPNEGSKAKLLANQIRSRSSTVFSPTADSLLGGASVTCPPVTNEALSNAAFLFSPSFASDDKQLLRHHAHANRDATYSISTFSSRNRLVNRSSRTRQNISIPVSQNDSLTESLSRQETSTRDSLSNAGSLKIKLRKSNESEKRVRFSNEIKKGKQDFPTNVPEDVVPAVESQLSDLTEETKSTSNTIVSSHGSPSSTESGQEEMEPRPSESEHLATPEEAQASKQTLTTNNGITTDADLGASPPEEGPHDNNGPTPISAKRVPVWSYRQAADGKLSSVTPDVGQFAGTKKLTSSPMKRFHAAKHKFASGPNKKAPSKTSIPKKPFRGSSLNGLVSSRISELNGRSKCARVPVSKAPRDSEGTGDLDPDEAAKNGDGGSASETSVSREDIDSPYDESRTYRYDSKRSRDILTSIENNDIFSQLRTSTSTYHTNEGKEKEQSILTDERDEAEQVFDKIMSKPSVDLSEAPSVATLRRRFSLKSKASFENERTQAVKQAPESVNALSRSLLDLEESTVDASSIFHQDENESFASSPPSLSYLPSFGSYAPVNPSNQHYHHHHHATPENLCLSPLQRTPIQARKWRTLAAEAKEKDKGKRNGKSSASKRSLKAFKERSMNAL